MDLVATAATEMASTVAEIARNATQTSQATQQAIGRAKQGDKEVDQTIHTIQQVAGTLSDTQQLVDSLHRDTESVGEALNLIKQISDRTNLLALNAAIEAARAKGMKVIALTGKDGGKMAGLADVEIRVPHFGYADRIQEVHIKVIHILIQLVEKEMAK